jgi:hypothetical protein
MTGLLVSGAATFGLLRLQAVTPLSAIWWNFALLAAAALTGLLFIQRAAAPAPR